MGPSPGPTQTVRSSLSVQALSLSYQDPGRVWPGPKIRYFCSWGFLDCSWDTTILTLLSFSCLLIVMSEKKVSRSPLL